MHWMTHVLGALFIMGVIMLVWIGQSSRLINKARISEIFFNVKNYQQKLELEYFKTGRWPKKFTKKGRDLGLVSVNYMSFDGVGRLDFYLSRATLNLPDKVDQKTHSSDYILSFVASRDLSSPFSSTVWLCGYAKPPSSFTALADNLTSVASHILPFSCR